MNQNILLFKILLRLGRLIRILEILWDFFLVWIFLGFLYLFLWRSIVNIVVCNIKDNILS